MCNNKIINGETSDKNNTIKYTLTLVNNRPQYQPPRGGTQSLHNRLTTLKSYYYY